MVRYFVREEAGEFVYLALQLCQQSLHNAMAQIHSALVRGRYTNTKARNHGHTTCDTDVVVRGHKNGGRSL